MRVGYINVRSIYRERERESVSCVNMPSVHVCIAYESPLYVLHIRALRYNNLIKQEL